MGGISGVSVVGETETRCDVEKMKYPAEVGRAATSAEP